MSTLDELVVAYAECKAKMKMLEREIEQAKGAIVPQLVLMPAGTYVTPDGYRATLYGGSSVAWDQKYLLIHLSPAQLDRAKIKTEFTALRITPP